MADTPTEIAGRLSEAQKAIVIGLDCHELAIADTTAILPPKKLAWQAKSLREMSLAKSRLNAGNSYLLWELTPLGQAVRAVLMKEKEG